MALNDAMAQKMQAMGEIRGAGLSGHPLAGVGMGNLGYVGPTKEQMEAQAEFAAQMQRRHERMEVLRLAAGCSTDAAKVVTAAEAFLTFLKGE